MAYFLTLTKSLYTFVKNSINQFIMRKNNLKLKQVLVLFAAFFVNQLLVKATGICDVPEEGNPIVIESDYIPQPRSITDIECYYLNGYVYIIGGNDITSINGTVTRLSDNMQWSDSCNSNMLQIAVPSDAGIYRLTFTLSDGSSYYGDYVL